MSLILRDEPADGVVRLTLNRPDKRNALSWALVDELSAQLAKLHDEDAQAVILAGAGSIFCAGADMKEQFSDAKDRSRGTDIGRSDLWAILETLPQVAIAAVAGTAVTGGFLLAYSCDFIVAERTATFRDTHALFGLIPTGGEVQRLLARVGPGRARELLMTSAPLDAETAAQWGVVTRLCEPGELEAAAMRLAMEITANDARSVRTIKRMVNGGMRTQMAAGFMMDELHNEGGTANVRGGGLERIEAFFAARDQRG